MNIIDNIMASTIEAGDQIIIDGDPIEVKSAGEDPEAPAEGIRIVGYSHETGDTETYDLYFGDYYDVWAI